jgi:hypothetical protein
LLVGRFIGVALILLGFASALAIFAGAFEADFALSLPKLWFLFGALSVLGTVFYSMCGSTLAIERTVRRMGIALLVLGAATGAVLWWRAQGGVRVDAPVQLWLLFAVSLLTGGVAVYSTSL